MVTKETVKDNPTLGEIGAPDLPESIKYNDILLHTPEIEIDKIHNMLKTDGQVVGLWRMLTTPIRSSNIRVTKPKSGTAREYNLVSEIFIEDTMRTSLASVLNTVMRMLIDGWAPHEIVWKIENGTVLIDKIAYRSPKTINVKVDKKGEIERYIQKPRLDSMEASIPVDKVLHFVFGSEWNPVFGRSMFIQAFYHYEKKHKLYHISHIAAQINALRLRQLEAPQEATEEEIKRALDKISRLGFNTSIHLPHGYNLLFPEIGNSDVDMLPYIQHHDVQMSKAVLSQVIDIGVEGQTGSFNLSDTHLDIFITNLELIAQYISDVFNRDLIPRLIDWNFGTGNYPKIQFLPFDREDRKFLANLFTRIAGSRNVNVTPEFMLELEKTVAESANFDIDYDEITEERIQQAKDLLDLETKKVESEINRNNTTGGEGQANNTGNGGDDASS